MTLEELKKRLHALVDSVEDERGLAAVEAEIRETIALLERPVSQKTRAELKEELLASLKAISFNDANYKFDRDEAYSL